MKISVHLMKHIVKLFVLVDIMDSIGKTLWFYFD